MANIILWNSCDAEKSYLIRPYGPHCLAQWLTHNGHTAHVIDFCQSLTTEQLVNITEKYITSDTIAVGVSTTFWKPVGLFTLNPTSESPYHEPNWVIKARNRLAGRFPKLQWLLGGTNIYAEGKRSAFDWTIFFGNAENELLKFVQQNTGKTSALNVFDITTSTCRYIDKLSVQSGEMLPMELGRGCQFKCKFCSYPMIGKKKGTYIRNFQTIEDDIIENYEKYGIVNYAFVDDTVNESTEKIRFLAEMSQRLPFRLRWVGYNRLDLIWAQRETLPLLEESGICGSFFGIESFHPDASKAVGKGWNGKHGKEFLTEILSRWRNKVNVTLGFITGLPGEPPQSVEETQEWCIENNVPTWRFSPLWMNRVSNEGSEFSRNYSSYGYRFPKPMNNTYWESDLWTQESAINLSQKLQSDPRRMSKVFVNTWRIQKYLALGFNLNDILSMPERQLVSNNDVAGAHTKFINNYVQDQLK